MAQNRDRLAVGLSVSAIAWCFIVAAWMRATPMMNGARYPSAAEAVGLVSLPALAAVGATWAAWRGRYVLLGLATGLVGLFSLVTGFSIGTAFVPAAGLLLWSTIASIARSSDSSGPPTPPA